MPMPDPATATDGVFCEGEANAARRRQRAVERLRGGGKCLMPTMTYLQAISDGLREEMRADERVFCMGEDIGVFGGAFKVTDGFIEEFGADRVMDTPLAESGDRRHRGRRGGRRHAAGVRDAVLRLHLLRLRPARQRRRQDALPPGAAPCPSRCGCRPAAASPAGRSTRRTPRRGSCTRPGIKVVAPSTAEDAKGLLISAIRDPNPVVFMEHKHLYRRVKGEVPDGRVRDAADARASRARATTSSVIAYGAMVHTALEATEDLDGASIEVLDLRSLVPLDEDAILDVGAQVLEGRGRRRGQRAPAPRAPRSRR